MTNYLDFTNDGSDQPPGQPKMVPMPPWPAAVAEQQHPADGGATCFREHCYEPDEPIDLRCPHCRTQVVVDYTEIEGLVIIDNHHERGCPWPPREAGAA